jgi:hypothetical protein
MEIKIGLKEGLQGAGPCKLQRLLTMIHRNYPVNCCNDEAPVMRGKLVFERRKMKAGYTQLAWKQERTLSRSLKNNKGGWTEGEETG